MPPTREMRVSVSWSSMRLPGFDFQARSVDEAIPPSRLRIWFSFSFHFSVMPINPRIAAGESWRRVSTLEKSTAGLSGYPTTEIDSGCAPLEEPQTVCSHDSEICFNRFRGICQVHPAGRTLANLLKT